MHSFMHYPDHSTPYTDILVCSHIHVVKINQLINKTLNKTFINHTMNDSALKAKLPDTNMYGLDHDEGQITSKVPHTKHSPHTSLTLCPLHTREHNIKRHWADP